MKILLCAGTFDLSDGKKSGLMNKMHNILRKNNDICFYNGGNYNDLDKIIGKVKDYEVVLWMAHVSNDIPKIRNIKEINPYTLLVGSKRNDNKYSFIQILNKSIQQKNNLTIEFKNVKGKFHMLLFDPLGTSWYDGFDLNELVNVLVKRLTFLLSTKRQNTYPHEEYIEIPKNEEFFKYTREVAKIFHQTIDHDNGVTRFLGNSSFIDKNRKFVYVTRRDVDKEYIDVDHFVATFLKDKLYYSKNKDGNYYKPSKDAIVQNNLYKKLEKINYIVHSHCYIKGAPFTKNPVPCGAIDEINEVLDVIKNSHNNNFILNYYKINLIGHGCLIFGSTIDDLKKTEFLKRKLPENIFKTNLNL